MLKQSAKSVMKAATADSTLKSTKKVLEDELAQEELVEFLDMDMDEPTEAAKDFKTSTWYSSSGTRCRRLDHYRTQEAQCVTEKPSIEKPSRIDIFHLSVSASIDS